MQIDYQLVCISTRPVLAGRIAERENKENFVVVKSGELFWRQNFGVKCEAETDLRAPVRARVAGHRPRPRSPPHTDSASTVHRRHRGGVPPLRRDGHRPRSPGAGAASPALERLTPSAPPGHIPAVGASSSPRRRRWGGGGRGRGVEERVGAGVGVVLLELEAVAAAGAWRGADAAGAAWARGRVGARGGGGGGVEVAARGGFERRRRHRVRWLTGWSGAAGSC